MQILPIHSEICCEVKFVLRVYPSICFSAFCHLVVFFLSHLLVAKPETFKPTSPTPATQMTHMTLCFEWTARGTLLLEGFLSHPNIEGHSHSQGTQAYMVVLISQRASRGVNFASISQ